MATATLLDRDTCCKCDRPTLTFDEQGRPICDRHATIFLIEGRIDLERGLTADLEDEES